MNTKPLQIKQKPAWSEYLTDDNKFALTSGEIIRRKQTLLSKNNVFNNTKNNKKDLHSTRDDFKKNKENTHINIQPSMKTKISSSNNHDNSSSDDDDENDSIDDMNIYNHSASKISSDIFMEKSKL